MAEQLSLDAGEAHGYLNAAGVHLDRALKELSKAASAIDAAYRLQPRDRKGRPLSAGALRLWGAQTAAVTAAMHGARSLDRCNEFLEEVSRGDLA